jgi:hypothetical protein
MYETNHHVSRFYTEKKFKIKWISKKSNE